MTFQRPSNAFPTAIPTPFLRASNGCEKASNALPTPCPHTPPNPLCACAPLEAHRTSHFEQVSDDERRQAGQGREAEGNALSMDRSEGYSAPNRGRAEAIRFPGWHHLHGRMTGRNDDRGSNALRIKPSSPFCNSFATEATAGIDLQVTHLKRSKSICEINALQAMCRACANGISEIEVPNGER